jgi:hypothetical protein
MRLFIPGLGYKNMCTWWVLYNIMPKKQRVTLEACQQFLNSYESEGNDFLYSIVTGDWSWVHHYDPELKSQSLQYRHPTCTRKKTFRAQPSA